MDHLVTQLVQFIKTTDSFFVVYLVSGVWVGMESLGIGLPIEPLLLLLGAAVSQRHLNPFLAITLALGAASLGALLGALAGYSIGRRAGPEIVRVGRFVGLNQTRANHVEFWLRSRGTPGVFAARFVPVLRGLAPYVLGASQEPLSPFLAGTIAGALGYNGIWVIAGFALGDHYQQALDFFNRYGLLALTIAIVVITILVVLRLLWVRFVWRRITAHFHRHNAPVTTSSVALQ
jgi:membrane protein DedA with SNARE-associated domain